MSLFSKITWCIIFAYCFYKTIKMRTQEKWKSKTIKKIEIGIYFITIILLATLLDMLFFRYIGKNILNIIIPLCVMLQVSMVVSIELLETKDKNERKILNKRIKEGVLRLIIALIFFAWVMWE